MKRIYHRYKSFVCVCVYVCIWVYICRQIPYLVWQDHIICVAGMILRYFPSKGLFKFDKKHYDQQNTNFANLTKSFGNHYIATCELPNVLTNLEQNKLGEVPCNIKWSNSHRIDPNAKTSCIHFSAASQGKMGSLLNRKVNYCENIWKNCKMFQEIP